MMRDVVVPKSCWIVTTMIMMMRMALLYPLATSFTIPNSVLHHHHHHHHHCRIDTVPFIASTGTSIISTTTTQHVPSAWSCPMRRTSTLLSPRQKHPSRTVLHMNMMMMMMIAPSSALPMIQQQQLSSLSLLPLTTTTNMMMMILSSTTTVLNEFYFTYPYLSALLTCSCKAGMADYIVQQHQIQQSSSPSSLVTPHPTDDFNPTPEFHTGRNLGFIVYGGFYQGLFQQYMYGTVFPQYFSHDDVITATTIVPQLFVDMLILGPLFCLPISYIVQSLCGPSSTTPSKNVKRTAFSSSSSWSGAVNTPWMNPHPTTTTTMGYGWDRNHHHNPSPTYSNKFQRSMLVMSSSDHMSTSPRVPPPTTTRTSSSSSTIVWSGSNENRHNPVEHMKGSYDAMFWLDHFPIVAAFHDTLVQVPFVRKVQDGLEQYRTDIYDQNILLKYWLLWIPIKCITFTIIPNHLRIVFIATISFFWMMILSSSTTSTSRLTSDNPKV